jgi:hypothetical protein
LYYINNTNSKTLRLALKITIPLVFLLAILYVYINGGDFLEQYSSEKVLESVSSNQQAFQSQSTVDNGSYFSLDEFDGSIGGLIKLAPMSIVTTFFRPFIWECRNMIMVLT